MGMDFLKRLFKSFKQRDIASDASTADPITRSTMESEGLGPASKEDDAADEAARRATSECLDRHWQSVGDVEQDVLGHAISPSFLGGPDWPSTRQAYRIVRRGDSVIIATDGLSDPFDGAPHLGNGFEMELFLETGDLAEGTRGAVGDVSPLMRSWAFDVVRTVASTVANAGGIRHQLETYGVLSLELPGASQAPHLTDQIPARFVTEDDCVGVLVGAPMPDFVTRLEDMPLSPVALVPVVLITAAELEHVRVRGRKAREALVEQLTAAGHGHRSRLNRPDLV
jgi:hypothetical protein